MQRKLFPLLVITATVLAGCTEENTDSAETEAAVTPVETAEVVENDLVIEKQFYATTMPEATTPVVPPAAGEIVSLEVERGDTVEEGDLLAELETADGRGTVDIEAPADGEVTALTVEEGGLVAGTEPFATIVDLETIIAKLAVPADALSLFEEHEEATVRVETAGYEEEVEIDYISPVPDQTGLYPVELSLNNEEGQLKPGMVAVVELPEQVVENTLLIPTTALVEENGESFVYVVEDNQAERVPVEVTEIQSDVTAIEAEIPTGAVVVTKGQITLTDGGEVSVIEEEQES